MHKPKRKRNPNPKYADDIRPTATKKRHTRQTLKSQKPSDTTEKRSDTTENPNEIQDITKSPSKTSSEEPNKKTDGSGETDHSIEDQHKESLQPTIQ